MAMRILAATYVGHRVAWRTRAVVAMVAAVAAVEPGIRLVQREQVGVREQREAQVELRQGAPDNWSARVCAYRAKPSET